MSQASFTLGYVYNPENQNDQELRERFVIRLKEFDKIIKELSASAAGGPAQHYLIEGQRGTGKTSLLLRIRSEVGSSDSLSRLLPVQFAEEQYGIFNLCGLWEKVAEELEDIDGFESLLDDLENQPEQGYEHNCFDVLERYLIKNKRRLLLLMDNFGDILDKFQLSDQQRLRDIFHNSDHIQLIAASAKSLEHTYQHDKPFFEFFKNIYLGGLSKQDTYSLLEKLAEVYNTEGHIKDIIENQQHRIESIRRLTGGIPRTIVLLFEIFMDESGGVFEDLESILDKVTPLYKHRMDDLSTQQQVIINALALNWDGMSTKELTHKISDDTFTSKKISSQLQYLQKNGLVKSEPLDNKNKLYFLQERFFNIWYLMRYGRKRNKQNVLWLVSFFKEWCSEHELHQRARRHIESAREGRLHSKGYLMAEGMARLIHDEELQHELVTETRTALETRLEDLDEKLSPSDKEVWQQALLADDNKNLHKAIMLYKKLIDKNSDQYAMYNLGYLYDEELKDFDKAIQYYKMAIEKDHTDAMANLGYLYGKEIKDFDKAIKYLKMAIEKDHTDAMANLGYLYGNEVKDFDKAIKYYKMAVEKDHAGSMYNLGYLYDEELKDFDIAIKYYKMAVEKDHAVAMYNLGYLYDEELKDFDKAIKYYKMAIEKDHTGAMCNLGNLYSEEELKDFDKAIKYYKMAIEKDHTVAMCNLGNLYSEEEIKDFDKAIKYYKMAIEKDDTDAMNGLAWLYYTLGKEPEEGLELAKQGYKRDKSPEVTHTLATVLLWNDKFAESLEVATEYLAESDHYLKFLNDVADYFILLMAKDQADSAYQLFVEKPDLKNQIKPVYHAVLTLLKDKYPKKYLRMGSDLTETTSEILKKVELKAEQYG